MIPCPSSNGRPLPIPAPQRDLALGQKPKSFVFQRMPSPKRGRNNPSPQAFSRSHKHLPQRHPADRPGTFPILQRLSRLEGSIPRLRHHTQQYPKSRQHRYWWNHAVRAVVGLAYEGCRCEASAMRVECSGELGEKHAARLVLRRCPMNEWSSSGTVEMPLVDSSVTMPTFGGTKVQRAGVFGRAG